MNPWLNSLSSSQGKPIPSPLTRRAFLASTAMAASASLLPTTAWAYLAEGGDIWEGWEDIEENAVFDHFFNNNSSWTSKRVVRGSWETISRSWSGTSYTPFATWCMQYNDYLGFALLLKLECDFATKLYYHIEATPYVAAKSICNKISRSDGWCYSPEQDCQFSLEIKTDGDNQTSQDYTTHSDWFDLNTDASSDAEVFSNANAVNGIYWTNYVRWNSGDPNNVWGFYVRRGYDRRHISAIMNGHAWDYYAYDETTSDGSHMVPSNRGTYASTAWLDAYASPIETWLGTQTTNFVGSFVWANRIVNISPPLDTTQSAYVGDGSTPASSETQALIWPAPEQLNTQWTVNISDGSCTDPAQRDNENAGGPWENLVSFANAMNVAHGQALWLDMTGGGPTRTVHVKAQVYAGNGSSAQCFWLFRPDIATCPAEWNIMADSSGHLLNRDGDAMTTNTKLYFHEAGTESEDSNCGSRWWLIDCWHKRREGNRRQGKDEYGNVVGDAAEKAFELTGGSGTFGTDKATGWRTQKDLSGKLGVSSPLMSMTYPYSHNASSLPDSAYSCVWTELPADEGSATGFKDPSYLNKKIAVWCRSYHGSTYGTLPVEQPTQNCAGLPGREHMYSFHLRLQNETGLSGKLQYQKYQSLGVDDKGGWNNVSADSGTDALTNATGAGVEGKDSNIGGFRCRLTGELAEAFDVTYRAFNGGVVNSWSDWAQNGEWTRGGTYVQAICIRIEPKWYKGADGNPVRVGFQSFSDYGSLQLDESFAGKAIALVTALELPNSAQHGLGNLRYLGHAASEPVLVNSPYSIATINYYADGEWKYKADLKVEKGTTYELADDAEPCSTAVSKCKRAGATNFAHWYSDADCSSKVKSLSIPDEGSCEFNVYSRNAFKVSFELTDASKSYFKERQPYTDADLTAAADTSLMKPADEDGIWYGTTVNLAQLWEGRIRKAYVGPPRLSGSHEIEPASGFYSNAAGTGSAVTSVKMTSSKTFYVDWPRAAFDGYSAS